MSQKSKKLKSISYKDAGVDIKAGDQLVKNIKPFAKMTSRKEVMGGLGGFGSMFEIPEKFNSPILVSGTDGVGTKLKLAVELNNHETIGQDLVAMCVNDILVQGAEPLFFLDYFACGSLKVSTATTVIKGIADGCLLAGCSLVGGETAEMPGMYAEGDYDLAGFCVGAVEKNNIIDGADVSLGDLIIGLASSGAHSNGYSLIRKIIEKEDIDINQEFDGKTLAEVLMKPTKIYVKSILELLGSVKVNAMAHITGGGITENIPRILPTNLKAMLNRKAWELPRLFKWLKENGNLSDRELYRTFNCGIGMAIVINPLDQEQTLKILNDCGEKPFLIGVVTNRISDEPQTEIN
ncbi:phosphoribosylformylglycinamidine cyclo-ligase [Methylophilaceae bacterium]|nr:phosphoribosylformylglycinamidine cyclo-ligase [Methylophilaceae bacterium]